MVTSAQGIDVADWQGHYDWAAAKRATPGLAFGIYRLTQGLGTSGTASPDPDAAWNHQQIAAQGLRRGAYHFLDPRESGAAQAQYFVAEHARLGTTSTDMFWLDNETAGASPSATAACAAAFMAELGKLIPRNPRGVYTFISFAREGYCAGLGRYPLWLAYPATSAPEAPAPWPAWTFWQYGQRSVDADAFNGTAAQLDAWLASFASDPVPPQNWTEAMIATLPTLKQGDTDKAGQPLHVHRVQVLVSAIGRWNGLGSVTQVNQDGSFGPATAAAVKRVQQFSKLTQDGICGPATWAALVTG